MNKCSHIIQLSLITHRGEKRIKVFFEKDSSLIRKIKSIEGRKWSNTKRCWYVPYDKKSFAGLKKVFADCKLEYPNAPNSSKTLSSPAIQNDNLDINYASYTYQGELKKKVIGTLIIAKQVNPKWIEFYVPCHQVRWVNVIKHINGRKWDIEKLCWILPNVKQSYWILKEHIGLNNIRFDYKIQKDIPESYIFQYYKKKEKQKTPPKGFELLNEIQKKAIYQLEEQIILRQLSQFTLKSYRNHLIALFLYFPKIDPENISVKDVEMYLLHQIKFKKISESTQNQIINSVKAYWEKVLNRPKGRIDIPRPKKPKHLPNVFSQEEVIQLIESPKNLKHKLILLLIYSAGLRIGEVVKIRTRDININRRVIFIKDGKGKKDRFVTLAEAVLPFLKKYTHEYRPTYWLIEGQSGGQYSKNSINKIFHIALKKSKIFAYGTVHTLRHSYATHCIENGFSIALLQEALGHQSIKTTEKYLHISSKALKKLKSPFDIIKNKSQD